MLKRYFVKLPVLFILLVLGLMVYFGAPFFGQSVKAATYSLSCASGVCTFVDSNGVPSYQGNSTVAPPTLGRLTPGCVDGEPVVDFGWRASPDPDVTWVHFHRFEVRQSDVNKIKLSGGGYYTSTLQSGEILETDSPVEVGLGYAGSTQVPTSTQTDWHYINAADYPQYTYLKRNTTYIYVLQAQEGTTYPPTGLMSMPSNVHVVTTQNCTFSQNLPIEVCEGVSNPKIKLSWGSSFWAKDYQVIYYDPSNNSVGGFWSTGGATSYDVGSSSGLVQGRPYGFIIRAINQNNQVPVQPSYTTDSDWKWGHEVFGTMWTLPNCTPPGPFSFTGPPVGFCQGPGDVRFTIAWTPSSGADSYSVKPQTNNPAKGNPPGQFAEFNIGKPATVNGAVSYTYQIPGLIGVGEGWEFAVRAHNATPYSPTNINSGSSYYAGSPPYRWTPVPDCSNAPTINFSVTTHEGTYQSGGIPAQARQNEEVIFNWSSVNATSCTASSNPDQSYWDTGVALSGTQPATIPTPGTYFFTLSCSNAVGTTTTGLQLDVEQYPKPFFQTTGGDVHSNEAIYITPP